MGSSETGVYPHSCVCILVLRTQDFGKAVGSGELSSENVENLIVKEKLVKTWVCLALV